MSGEGQCVSDLSLQFRISHSALRIRNYRTNKLPDPLFPSLTAVTSDDPDRSARITTDWPATASTLATVESLTDQVTGRPERMFPPASRSVAKNLAVSPAATTAVSGVTETVATESLGGGGGAESVTLSCAEPLLPSLVAVMSATPAPVVRITTV